MPSTLLMRLEGPLQKWGNNLGGIQPTTAPEISVGGFGWRSSQPVPTKSGVLGLCAAALGIDRAESVEHLRQLTFGVRIDRAGTADTDFQTAQLWPDRPAHPTENKTALVAHALLADASFLVGLEGDLELLGHLYAALQNPYWPLSLGRKSYLPSKPIFQPGPPVPFELAEALSRATFGREDGREEPQAVYLVESRAAPADVRLVDAPGWDEPDRPFAERHYQTVQAVRYRALWGQVLSKDAPPVSQPRPRTTIPNSVDAAAVRRVRDDTKTEWTEAETAAENLPAYYSATWFEREFAALGTLAAMEAKHHYSNQALSEWAQRHGINIKPRIGEATWERVRELLSLGWSAGRIASEVGIAKPSVQWYARGMVN